MKEFILFSVQHVINTSLDKGAESFFLCRCHFGCINRCSDFDGYRLLLNLWNMGLENIFCIFYGDGNDRPRVPSGKRKMEVPFLINSMQFKMVFSPSRTFSRSRNWQLM